MLNCAFRESAILNFDKIIQEMNNWIFNKRVDNKVSKKFIMIMFVKMKNFYIQWLHNINQMRYERKKTYAILIR